MALLCSRGAACLAGPLCCVAVWGDDYCEQRAFGGHAYSYALPLCMLVISEWRICMSHPLGEHYPCMQHQSTQ